MKLLVYIPVLTSRIKYIFNFIFKDVLKTDLEFSLDLEEFMESDLPKFCYSGQIIGGTLCFKSTSLLTEHTISLQEIRTTTFGDSKVPFAVEGGALPFDVFAASFYFLSRYEEYLPFDSIQPAGYPAVLSLQYKLGLLQSPVIDEWALILKNILLKHFPSLTFGKKDFSFNPTYCLYARPAVTTGRFSKMVHTLSALVKPDRTAARLENQLEEVNQLIADLDKRGLVERPRVLLPDAAQQNTNLDEMLEIPNSYLKLIKTNTEQDYSMYYPNIPGFRAGSCTPFYWYDLQIEKQTQLRVHPIAVTDKALLTGNHAGGLLLQFNTLMDRVKFVNGTFYTLWHHAASPNV